MATKFEFAKIFELEDYQVLITKDEDDEKYRIMQSTQLEDCMPSLALGYELESTRDKHFNEYNIDNAQKFLDMLKKVMEG